MKRHEIEAAKERGGAIARVEIRWTEGTSVRAALRLLTDVVLDVVVRSREVEGVHPPAQVASRVIRDEQGGIFVTDGSRWND